MSGVLEQLSAGIGRSRLSDWLVIDQPMINRFADATLDHQFIHVDEDRAATTPFGGTIAHGFLTLSLLPYLHGLISDVPIPGLKIGVNYGLDRVRFVHPVRAGRRVRAVSTLTGVVEKRSGQFHQTHDISVEIEGETRPALIAIWLTQFHI